jgi:hypothetical protein
MKITPKTTLIKILARGLRYLPLPEFVGQQVMIQSVDTVADDIRCALSGIFPEECNLLTEAGILEGMMAKYNFLDLTFSAPPYLLESQYQSGISLLKDLGFIRKPSEVEEYDDDFEGFNEGFIMNILTDIAKDISKNITVLRLFLTTDPPPQEEINWEIDLPPEYLPRLFIIKDACIANAGSVWFHQYFYL